MTQRIKKWLTFLFVCLTAIALVSCGSASSSSDSSSDSSDDSSDNEVVNDYSGDVVLSGTATALTSDLASFSEDSTSRVSSMRTNSLRTAAYHANKLKALASLPRVLASTGSYECMEGATVKLFAYDDTEDDFVDTGLRDTVEDCEYSFNVSDDELYAIKVKQFGKDSQGNNIEVEVESMTQVDSGATAVSSDINPVTKLIMSAVIESLNGVSDVANLDASTIDLITSAITESINTLVTTGIIKIDSAVKVVAEEEVEDEDSTDTITFGSSNSADTQKIELIASDETVSDALAEGETKSKLSKDLTLEEAKSVIRGIISSSQEREAADPNNDNYSKEGDIPDFYLTAFAQAFLDGVTITVGDLAEGLNASIYDELETIKGEILSVDSITNMFLEHLNSTEEDVKSIAQLYDIYDNSEANSEDRRSIPAVIRGAFPANNRITLPATNSTVLNVPQGLLIFGLAGFFGEDEDLLEGAPNDEIDHMMDEEDGMFFNPIDFVTSIGFAELNISADHQEIIINWAEIRPTSVWVPGEEQSDNNGNSWTEWYETKALMAYLDVEVLGAYSSDVENEEEEVEVAAVKLLYPNREGGTSSVMLDKETWEDKDCHDCGDNSGTENEGEGSSDVISTFSLKNKHVQMAAKDIKSKAIKTKAEGDTLYYNTMSFFRLEPWYHWTENGVENEPTIIDDFDTGEAMFQICADENCEDILATKEITIINPDLGEINWVFPKGPDQSKFNFGGDPNWEPQELDTNEEGTTRPTLQWTDVDPSRVPEGYKLGYRLRVSLELNKIQWDQPFGELPDMDWDWPNVGELENSDQDPGYRGKSYYEPWDNRGDRIIKSNKYTLLVDLPETERNTEENYETYYRAEIQPVLIDPDTKQTVWEGSFYENRFKVGLTAPWTINLTGTVQINPDYISRKSQNLNEEFGDNWKIGLFQFGGQGDNGWEEKFWTDEDTPRTPVTKDDLVLVSDLTFNDDYEAEFELDEFTKVDELLENYANYGFLVWQDDNDDDAIEYQDHYVSEEFYWVDGNINKQPGGIFYGYWDKDTDSWKDQELTIEDNQDLEIKVGYWY